MQIDLIPIFGNEQYNISFTRQEPTQYLSLHIQKPLQRLQSYFTIARKTNNRYNITTNFMKTRTLSKLSTFLDSPSTVAFSSLNYSPFDIRGAAPSPSAGVGSSMFSFKSASKPHSNAWHDIHLQYILPRLLIEPETLISQNFVVSQQHFFNLTQLSPTSMELTLGLPCRLLVLPEYTLPQTDEILEEAAMEVEKEEKREKGRRRYVCLK